MRTLCWDNFRSYNEADNDPIGFFRFTQYEAYATDNWKAARNLSFEFGARLYHYQPTFTQANNVANFDPSLYNPSQAVTIVGSTGLIDLDQGWQPFQWIDSWRRWYSAG